MESDSFDEENNVEFDAKETDSEEDDEGLLRWLISWTVRSIKT